MVEKRKPIAVDEAVQRVMDYAFPAKKELVPLTQAYGRFIAEDMVADHDVPAFDRSPYDGYAIRSMDSQEASSEHPIRFQVVGEIGAGFVHEEVVGYRQAVRIMTGAPIPKGCDAVVMLELTQTFEENHQTYMSIKRSFAAGTNISYKGEDVRQGTTLITAGQYINPGVMALLATFGYQQVPVFRKVIVGVIATGSELLEPEEALQPGKIRNSNAYMVMAQIERAGADVQYFGKLSDDLDLCIEIVSKALQEVDILLTTGGVSVGDYDYLPAIYQAIQADVLFNKVAMRPGSVTTVAARNGQLLFGLSGNPSACYVGFELFVRPIIRSAFGNPQPHLRREQAILGADFTKPNPFTRFVRASAFYEKGQLIAVPSGFDKSSAVSSLAAANAFIMLPGGSRGYEKGMQVAVLLLEDLQGSEWTMGQSQKILQIVGYQNSGKTTLMEQLIAHVTVKGLRVGTIKHHGHGGIPTIEATKDSLRHEQAGASVTAVEGGGTLRLSIHQNSWQLADIVAIYADLPMDLILVEGYKNEQYPKVVLLRTTEDQALLQQVSNILCVLYWQGCTLDTSLAIPAFAIDDQAQYMEFLWTEMRGK